MGGDKVTTVSNMFGAWAQTAEHTILGHHGQHFGGRSRSQGPRLVAQEVQRPEHARSQPLADSIASWWARAHAVLLRLHRHRVRDNGSLQ
eukprot:1381911-Pyramimonas_sp.AAC.2